MSYFKVLGLFREPFSTSPDPDFFYQSREHETALLNLLIDLRLKRGLSVVLGDVGTGKTTLSRALIQELRDRQDIIFSIILDPAFENEQGFLLTLAKNFGLRLPRFNRIPSVIALRDSLERFLFQKGVREHKTIVLIIDEAQKLSDASLELLRVFLNYETNESKLLQLILLGQLELYPRIMQMSNFYDRISFKCTLEPLTLVETAEMIEFRLARAGSLHIGAFFTQEALQAMFHFSSGYPRQITMIAHRALKEMVLKNKLMVDDTMIQEIVREERGAGWHVTRNARGQTLMHVN